MTSSLSYLDIHTLPYCFHLITWLLPYHTLIYIHFLTVSISSHDFFLIIPRYTYTSLLFPSHHMTSSLSYLDIHTLPYCFHLITWLLPYHTLIYIHFRTVSISSHDFFLIIPRYTYTSLLFPFHHMTSSLSYLDIHTLPYCFHFITWLLPYHT